MSHVCTKEVILSLIDDIELIAREMLGKQLYFEILDFCTVEAEICAHFVSFKDCETFNKYFWL
jgi:hypothetical protein